MSEATSGILFLDGLTDIASLIRAPMALHVIASEAKQSSLTLRLWIASSLRSSQ
jgi:hypothetical protein